MIRQILKVVAGKEIARRYGSGARGVLIGAAVPIIARRAFGPLGLAIGGGYLAKKAYDAHKEREQRRGRD